MQKNNNRRKNLKIAHICSGYPDTKLYQNLLREIDKNEIEQVMYVPYKTSEVKNKRLIESNNNIKFIFSNPYDNIDRKK